MWHFIKHPPGIRNSSQLAVHVEKGGRDEDIIGARGGRQLARERVCDGASGRGGHAGGGSEHGGEGVRCGEDGVGGGHHGAEMGKSGEGLVAGERVEEGVPRGNVAQGGGDVGEDGKGCAE